jgi:hypothetical protein
MINVLYFLAVISIVINTTSISIVINTTSNPFENISFK